MGQQLKKTALYCRLSKDDERIGESASIETQKTLLSQYAKEHNFYPMEFYIDDGYTGLNFDRPAFQRMIEDVALGKIDTVITKDLSRLGRDHIKTGEYSEIYFPTHKVRYIAINDNYDSEDQQSTYYGSIKTAINEFYSRDASVKIKAAFRARSKAGKYHTKKPPYGYIKDPADHNHLIPDPESAWAVKKIYELVLKGWGNYRIRDYLREARVPIPSWHMHSRGLEDKSYLFPTEESKYIWRPDTLRLLIRNQVYCGDTVACKTEAIFKTNRCIRKPEDKCIVVPNTHEALVSRETWERANELIAIKRRDAQSLRKEHQNIFAGLLKCGDCGKAMTRRKYGSQNGRLVYVCTTYATYGAYRCTQHKVFEEDLINAVSADIRRHAAEAKKNPEELIRRIIGYKKSQDESRLDTESEAYKALVKRKAEIERAFDRLYDDHLTERITYENFERLAAKYQAEQKDLQDRMAVFEAASASLKDRRSQAEKVAESLAKYSDFDELTHEMLYSLIDRIEVFDPQVIDGRLEQVIKVFYRFVGVIEPVEFDATRFYKSGEVTCITGRRAARKSADTRLAERKKLTLEEIQSDQERMDELTQTEVTEGNTDK